jgi:hypothetical protein
MAVGARQMGKSDFEEIAAKLVSDLLESREVATLADSRGPAPAAPTPPVAQQATPAAAAQVSTAAYKQGASQPDAFALVIGIESYGSYPPPSGARSDALAFAALAQKTLGMPAQNVRLLIDHRATRTTILKEIHWLKSNISTRSRIYFFFSGHGAPDPASGVAYLLPADGDAAALDLTALKVNDVMNQLAATGAEEVVAFVDSCFSGSGGRSVLPKGVRPLVRVQEAKAQTRVSMLAAASGDQIAGPAADGNNGLFTHYLLEGLGNGSADIDGDGRITADELASWVTPRVAREAKRESREQTPHLVGSASAFVVMGLR